MITTKEVIKLAKKQALSEWYKFSEEKSKFPDSKRAVREEEKFHNWYDELKKLEEMNNGMILGTLGFNDQKRSKENDSGRGNV